MRRYILLTGLILTLVVWASSAQAAVQSIEVNVFAFPERTVTLPLQMSTTTTLAGINGQLNYDPARFTNPRVDLAAGSPGYIVLGNEVTPGQYRFVLYANPTGILQVFNPLIAFKLDTTAVLPAGTSVLSYTLEAASDPNGVSLPDVNFANASVTYVQPRNAVADWLVYN